MLSILWIYNQKTRRWWIWNFTIIYAKWVTLRLGHPRRVILLRMDQNLTSVRMNVWDVDVDKETPCTPLWSERHPWRSEAKDQIWLLIGLSISTDQHFVRCHVWCLRKRTSVSRALCWQDSPCDKKTKNRARHSSLDIAHCRHTTDRLLGTTKVTSLQTY